MPTSTETPSGPSVYVIQEGDSLSSIAKKFNTSLEVLMALNPNINPDMIRVGEQVIIPAPNTELPTTTPVPADLAKGTIIEYRVVTGDSLGAIAERFNSTVDEILKKNPEIKKADDIKAGQVIKVPVNIVTPIPTATQGTVLPTIVPPATSTSTPQG
jgi:peptidoglycan endopeptidase LytE